MVFQLNRRLDAQDIQQLLNATNSLEPKAVVTQVGLMTGLSVSLKSYLVLIQH